MGHEDDGGRVFAPHTEVVRLGRDPLRFDGFVNTPVVRGSTVLSPTYDDLVHHRGRYSYGRRGNPTTEALEGALQALEGSDGVVLTPSGLSACGLGLLSVLGAGDHLLMVDTVYKPTRLICDTVLKRLGVATTYYDPLVGAGIADLIGPNTRAIFLESPGSQSFEMQDVPAITAIARARGITTLIDNTWATPLFFKPHAFGVDVSIQAGTKYIGGHADLNLGTVSAVGPAWRKVHDTHGTLGITISPDDAALGARGLRTMAVRLERHHASGLEIARWLEGRPEVSRVLHPALPTDPGFAIWSRDFTGASGLFSFILKPVPERAMATFFDALALFGMGYSWGGYESLAIPFDCADYRTATTWKVEGPAVRIHIGLEDVDDLKSDIDQAFAKMRAAAG
ncbi:cystathionine beta-lyase [Xanthobacter tagetidis]|uniref:Cystathionine beta-lyase n=1 Tax=Xanthobacter tagetidis TaxID=60216 RepID=A0A3L7AKN0_9HYPH|nr:cystathionine beta-lyase [Xanthobacter tagetidis]MBB6307505.1 cystathionine beta-lyase [Xanthobacter tagetidis]RLP81083.1 cystathionine beta-lyase [Xanthobacter tagetidis]